MLVKEKYNITASDASNVRYIGNVTKILIVLGSLNVRLFNSAKIYRCNKYFNDRECDLISRAV